RDDERRRDNLDLESRGRHHDPERRPLTDLALDLDLPAEAGHDPMADRQAETGPDTDRLRREERIEDPGQALRRDARARVPDFHHDAPRSGIDPSRYPDHVLVGVPFLNGLRG